ncbi:MAG: 2Fe-2S iron-sulfur cluster binding domain-containing protein [Planctomycetes bacterium]|jgi:[NiFe] hydrogenase diaphorase moiety small subunit|nr:2Fe-2S iron-sulfur cluster binding domain-containing protein [Planctomycetota bacterium]MBT4028167.1 2Fe-2S iron-sulfur cluster binding domain-containing protein [Planctomycetota bacterium]MBT4560708.1 2Fe-2S iron-sulfur cluster binding domain-containing protein [Planctomycetota bacterium]MBT5101926.1 2Fe-2S iron-sulfur cluster binding domain-containing protein [Planctomycetota bacterium]MBT7011280.1 2Fe-2S iron-sulfur cluster binding domain-containing protein [Planctomycetota bacterium]
MTDSFTINVDGRDIQATKGQTILEAAEAAGIYIPRLCHHPELKPHGSCRICTVIANGRSCTSCTQPAEPDMEVQNNHPQVEMWRKQLIEMLFVEGNHFCPFCEKSGGCELQALGYRHGLTATQHPHLFPRREIDATHPDIMVDHNRCVLCGRCVRASRDVDGKRVFQFVERGPEKRVAVNSDAKLSRTDVDLTDKAVGVCPVGAILPKRQGYVAPVGAREFDHTPIGTSVEGGNGSLEV